MTRILALADVHLSPREVERYRWTALTWAEHVAIRYEVDAIVFVGDLVHNKDMHPAWFVDKLTKWLLGARTVCPIYWLAGNHDADDPRTPFFRFVSGFRGIEYVDWRCSRRIGDATVNFIPYYRKPTKWTYTHKLPPADLCFIHQPVRGARAANGQRVDGIPSSWVSFWPTLAGDIHVPQVIEAKNGKHLTYIGPPHPVHFGEPGPYRAALWEDGETRFLTRSTIRRESIVVADPLTLRRMNFGPGDQVRITVPIHRRDAGRWDDIRGEIRRAAEAMRVQVLSLEMKDARDAGSLEPATGATPLADDDATFDSFCEATAVPEVYRHTGRRVTGVVR